jgi:hypothetical protein
MEPEIKTASITIPTAQLLLNILGQTTLAVGSEDFDELAPAILAAKKELTEALSA